MMIRQHTPIAVEAPTHPTWRQYSKSLSAAHIELTDFLACDPSATEEQQASALTSLGQLESLMRFSRYLN